MLHGRVLDRAGQPVAGATVAVSGPRASVVMRTGADGAFRAEWLPAGEYRLIAVGTLPPRTTSVLLTIGADADRVQNLTHG